MTAQNELSALISKTVEEQTFSLDAVKAIGAIRDRAVTLEASLAQAQGQLDSANVAITQRDTQLANWASKEAAMKAREEALTKREVCVTNLERGTAVAQAQFSVLDGVFKTIFANRGVRETVTKSVPIVQQPNASGMSGYVTNHTETTTTDTSEG